MISSQPLKGCVVGISISESDELESLGFDRAEMNRCVVRLSETLLANGARLAFGHDWRPGGVMEAVAALAVRYFNLRRNAEGRVSPENAPIINRVAAPDVPYLTQQSPQPGSEPATPPPGNINPIVRLLEGVVDARPTEAPKTASRSEALSLMRQELAGLCDVRVCLGGKTKGFSGKMPGIIEEALLTLRRERPVFASAIFGGASNFLVQAMSGGNIRFGNLEALSGLREQEAEIYDRAKAVSKGLNDQEMGRLWRTNSIEECIELVLRGAVKVWQAKTAREPEGLR